VFYHDKALMIPVRVQSPNRQHAALVLEQFGGANGELKACLQYFVQSFGVTDPRVRDLLLDISTEEISHLELVGTVVSQFLAPVRTGEYDGMADPTMRAEADALRNANSTAAKALVLGGGGPLVADASGTPFTGAYINANGDLFTDLTSDFAAEMRAKRVYEMLYREVPDRGAREVFDFLIEREEAHSALFHEALDRARDLGVMRDYGDTELARRYPALSRPCEEGRSFRATEGTEPIRGPLDPQEVRIGLARNRPTGVLARR
jgi:Mn-containing catalase